MTPQEKARALAIQYTEDVDDNYDVRCEWACNEMAEWCDRRHNWRVGQADAVMMAHKYTNKIKKERRGNLSVTLEAELKRAFLAGAEAVHEELTGVALEIPF